MNHDPLIVTAGSKLAVRLMSNIYSNDETCSVCHVSTEPERPKWPQSDLIKKPEAALSGKHRNTTMESLEQEIPYDQNFVFPIQDLENERVRVTPFIVRSYVPLVNHVTTH